MSESVTPYDPNQMANMAGHIRKNGPVITPPFEVGTPEKFTQEPTGQDEQAIATGGLFKSLGRHFTRESRIQRVNHRVDVITEAANLITDARGPLNPGDDPIAHAKKKVGWEGIYKPDRKVGSHPRPEDDFTQLGSRLLFEKKRDANNPDLVTWKRKGDIAEMGPNPYRPVTWAEKFAVKRLGWLTDRRRQKENDAAWIRNSYPAEEGDSARMSNRQRRRQASMNRQVRRNERKAIRAQKKFDKIANNENRLFAVSRHNQKRRTKGRPEPQQQASATVDPRLRYPEQPFNSTYGAFDVQTMLADLPNIQRRAPQQPAAEVQPTPTQPEHLAPVPLAPHSAPQEDLDAVMQRLHRNLLGEDMAEPQEESPESLETEQNPQNEVEQANQSPFGTALEVLAGRYRKDAPNVKFDRMSIESFTNSLARFGVTADLAQFIYKDFQGQGLIADSPIPGEGYRVTISQEDLEKILRIVKPDDTPDK